MNDTDEFQPHYNEMLRAIGQCLMTWAMVEYELGNMWSRFHGDAPVSAEVWASIVSFDARITMLQRVLALRFAEGEIRSDTTLLLNETRKRYRNRNEVAHSTLMMVGNGALAIEPFMVIGKPNSPLPVAGVYERRDHFRRLAEGLSWLYIQMDPMSEEVPPSLRQAFQRPPPDLVRELRDAESQRRKAQSEQQKLLRHALKLQAEGRLPDWPPDQDLGDVVQSASS